jgi:hypothetical protein
MLFESDGGSDEHTITDSAVGDRRIADHFGGDAIDPGGDDVRFR